MGGDVEEPGDIKTGEPSSFLRFFLPLPRRLGVAVGVSVSFVDGEQVACGVTMGGVTMGAVTMGGVTTGGLARAASRRVFLPLPRRLGVEVGVDVPLIVKKRQKRGRCGIKMMEISLLLFIGKCAISGEILLSTPLQRPVLKIVTCSSLKCIRQQSF